MCSSASRTPTPSTPGTLSSGGSAPSLPPTSSPSQESGASSILNQLTSGTLTGGSTTGSEGASTTGALSGTNSGSLSASPSPPVISFPSGSPNAVSQTTDVPLTAFTRSSSLPPVNSQFSYITIFSLLGVSVQTSPIPSSMTDPDAPTTTLSLIAPSSSLTGQVTPVPLPSDLPARIYPVNQIGNLPGGYTLCSILFDSSLPWDFVASNTQSQGQIFAWTQVLIMNALNISTSETPPYALQVFVPATYVNASDSSLLLTQYLFLLSADLVATLADQIKVPSSAFYDAGEPYVELAKHINPAYGLTSVPDPSAIPGSSSGAVSHGDKSRTDTIIGVVGGLGGLAFIILGVLIFNGVKRSRELRHRRLSDPNLPNDPYPDRTGRDFDQDSVGGQRRRSFYFAEDSLRGQQQQSVEQSTVPVAQAQTQYVVQPGSQVEYSHRTSPESMRERRGPVLPGAISAPILTQSSLNW
ncbi:hypothetical protein BJV74DRAFT_194351 [Russula compacta]|nr:hypothetical protein BJV74DRAFT_194351 [Russula compacta]